MLESPISSASPADPVPRLMSRLMQSGPAPRVAAEPAPAPRAAVEAVAIPDAEPSPRRMTLAGFASPGGIALPELNNDALRAKLAKCAFNHANPPIKPAPILTLGKWDVSTPGNILSVQGPVKAGKSAVLAAIMGAMMKPMFSDGDTLGFHSSNPNGWAVIALDTEQSDYDSDALVRRAMRRAGIQHPPSWFYSYCLTAFDIRERLDALRLLIADAVTVHGGVFCIIIDGIADMCASPNDEQEAFALVAELHALAVTHQCAVVAVLHENPGSDSGKMRGHLGSQLERKAETPLRLAKDAATGVTVMWSDRCRHNHIPQKDGVCFKWDDAAGMHVSCGTVGAIKAEAKRSKYLEEAERVFSDAAKFSYSELVARIMDAAHPDGKTMAKSTAENRVKTYAAEGLIRKMEDGNYTMPPGLPSTLELPSIYPN